MRFYLGLATCCLVAVPEADFASAENVIRVIGNPAGWAQVGAPSEDSITCANWSLRSWRLDRCSAQVPAIVPNDELEPRRDPLPFPFECPSEAPALLARRVALPLGKAWLVGCDLGERGGGLWLVDAEGHRAGALWNERVRDITSVGGRAFVLSQAGVDDLGQILVVPGPDGPRAARPLARTPGYPIGLFQRDDGLVVVTTAGLFQVNSENVSPLTRFGPIRTPSDIDYVDRLGGDLRRDASLHSPASERARWLGTGMARTCGLPGLPHAKAKAL
jgi:hypothetical protein